MNIFILDQDPALAAEGLHDTHLVKMILESAQLLSGAARRCLDTAPEGLVAGLYAPTHINHPCAKWTRQSSENFSWLLAHFESQLEHYTLRFNRQHASARLAPLLREAASTATFPETLLTPFAQAMPDAFRHPDPVVAYRKYYRETKAFTKSGKFMARYRSPASPPAWWDDYDSNFHQYIKEETRR